MELELDGLLAIRSSARDHPEHSNFDKPPEVASFLCLEIYDAKLAAVQKGELDH
jgi:hypothetical protein